MTRSSHNWKGRPGSFDTLHVSRLFPTDGNAWGIPSLHHAPMAYIPNWLVPYRSRLRDQLGTSGGAVHFFLDDYRFETVWNRSEQVLRSLKPYTTLLTPDFSLYSDYPRALQIFNTYRSRWCGAFWHQNGFKIIPTVSWATPDTYPFCFTGIPLRSLVAISSVGIRKADYTSFSQGYQAMVERLVPSCVLCYGPRLIAELEALADVRYFQPDMVRLRSYMAEA